MPNPAGRTMPPWAAAAIVAATLVAAWLAIPGPTNEEAPEDGPAFAETEAFPSTYKPLAAPPTAIVGATILTGTGEEISDGTVLFSDGKIVAVGAGIDVPEGTRIIEAKGKFVTPGIIDMHSHLGVYPSPSAAARADGNEATKPVTAEVRSEHSIWPQDPGFTRALAGGITTLAILPGSANLIGGRTVVVKNVPSRTMQGMKFPGAPYGLKMACGENPKRVYGDKGGPSTNMGNVAGYRAAFGQAQAYRQSWVQYREAARRGDKSAQPPPRDLAMETLVEVLEGRIAVQNHCYRADEMAIMIDIAKEFGFRIAAFHHASEAYKVADVLRDNDICAAMWADWWGFKLESYDGIQENIALVDAAGACAVVHSDSEVGIQRLNQEAAKAMAAGRRMGLNITRAQAIRWLTANPARATGVLDKTGTLEAGKMADVVIWDGDPFSVYSHAEIVFIDGATIYDRNDPARSPRTDFELGLVRGRGTTGGAGQ